jgi:hypothetical protein
MDLLSAGRDPLMITMREAARVWDDRIAIIIEPLNSRTGCRRHQRQDMGLMMQFVVLSY